MPNPTVNANNLSVVHQGSGGIAVADVPDVCKTPSPNGPAPIPYPNIARSSDLVYGSRTVTIDGYPAAIQTSKFAKSTGDEAGTAGGVASNIFAGEASFLSFSPTVMIEGKPVCRLTDKMLMNKGNTVCMSGVMQAPVVATPPVAPDTELKKTQTLKDPKKCVLKKVKVRCKHYKDRHVELDLSELNTKAAKAQGQGKKKKHIDAIHRFEVIRRTRDPEALSITWEGDCGYGDSHKDCPTVVIDSRHLPDGEKYLDGKNKKYDFDFDKETKVEPQNELCSENSSPVSNGAEETFSRGVDQMACNKVRITMEEVLNHFVWGEHLFDVYPEYYNLHGIVRSPDGKSRLATNQWLQVVVYPELSCDGTFSVSYQKPINKDLKAIEESKSLAFSSAEKSEARSNFASSGKAHETNEDKWTIEGKIDFRLGQNHVVLNWETGQTLQSEFPKVGELANKLTKQLNTLNDISKHSLVDVGIVWPVWKLTAKVERIEVANSPLVSTDGSFEIALAPLFGVSFESDIIDWIIYSLGGPLGKALTDIKKLAATGIGDSKSIVQAKAVLKIVLTVTGRIDGKLKINFKGGKTNLDTTNAGTGITFKLKAEVLASGRVWRIGAKAGIEAGTTSADAKPREAGEKPSEIRAELYPKKGDLFAVGARVRCTGIKIYYYYYYEYGVSGAENDQKDKGNPRGGGRSIPSSVMNRPKEGYNEAIIMEPWIWPEGHV